MTAAEVKAWEYPSAFPHPLVGWDAAETGPMPPPCGHTRIAYGPCTTHSTCTEPGAWLASIGGREAFVAACGPEDVVAVQLTASSILRPSTERHPDFAEHCEIIREIAPRVRGVLVGDMACEFVGRPQTAVELASIVLRAGGTPFLGTTDWTLLRDCYTGGTLRKVLSAMGAGQVCFCAYTLSPACWFDHAQPLYSGQRQYQLERDGVAPSPRLCDYLAECDVWADVNWMEGLQAGNDRELHRMGFTRGCL